MWRIDLYRDSETVRPIQSDVSILPLTHGCRRPSQEGKQPVSRWLQMGDDEKFVDGLDETFPTLFCTGETGRTGFIRREISWQQDGEP